MDLNTASKGKYAQVLGEVGNYAWLQKMLGVLEEIAGSHGVTIADVATRWVMDKPAVGAVIIGAQNFKLGRMENRFTNPHESVHI